MFITDCIKDNIILLKKDEIRATELEKPEAEFVVSATTPYLIYRKADIMQRLLREQRSSIPLSDVTPIQPALIVNKEQTLNDLCQKAGTADIALITDGKNTPVAVFDHLQNMVQIMKEMGQESWRRDLKLKFFQSIFYAMEDEIFIADEYGFIVYMNPRSEYVCQVGPGEYIGRHVSEMVENNILSKSVTLEVLATGERVAEIVYISSGRHILSTSQPIYDKKGNIAYVLSTSKDIKEINEMAEKLVLLSRELDEQKKEVERIKTQLISEKKYVFESPAMKEVKATIMRIAPTNVTVLIEGQSGTGKEVVADLIHRLSKRQGKPFVKINCGLIPKDLLESELFGYMPGAFTGAAKTGKTGKIETANGGTVFFDEIGELPLSMQVKLLEFLQDRHIVRVGGIKEIDIDVRIIAATNRKLKEMVGRGEFREDLYYRLNVMPVSLRPLGERKEDIFPLAKMFLEKFNEEYNNWKTFDAEILDAFLAYDWPGNVRELMHTIERLFVSTDKQIISASLFKKIISGTTPSRGNVMCTGIIPLKQARQELEYTLVKNAYEKYGSTYAAASALEVNQSTVSRILKKYP